MKRFQSLLSLPTRAAISRADSQNSMNRVDSQRAESVSESELSEDVSDAVEQVVMIQGRGLHASTFQLNLSRF